MDTEVWAAIPGYDRYLASNLGNIKLVNGGKGKNITKILSTYLSSSGYVSVKLWLDGIHQTKCTHQLIALAFIGECPAGCEVHHIDHNRQNNRADNLTYLPIRENRQHRRKPLRKKTHLTPDEIIHVIGLLKTGIRPRAITQQFNISPTAIYLISEVLKTFV